MISHVIDLYLAVTATTTTTINTTINSKLPRRSRSEHNMSTVM